MANGLSLTFGREAGLMVVMPTDYAPTLKPVTARTHLGSAFHFDKYKPDATAPLGASSDHAGNTIGCMGAGEGGLWRGRC